MNLQIKLSSPFFYVGKNLKGEVEVECVGDIEFEEIRLEFEGTEKINFPCRDSNVCPSPTIFLASQIFETKRRIKEGNRIVCPSQIKIPFELFIPPWTPPTYRGKYVQTNYVLRVKLMREGVTLFSKELPIKIFLAPPAIR